MELTHTNCKNEINMVSVSNKESVRRIAKAYGKVKLLPEVINLIKENKIKKGNVLTTAKIAGIMSAKNTSGIIPLCHNIPIELIDIDFKLNDSSLEIFSNVESFTKTGVEMEALTAVSVAALTIYDMCKSADKNIVISEIKLLEKLKLKKFKITSLNISKEKGVSKIPVNKILVKENFGIEGDAHASFDTDRQISLLDIHDMKLSNEDGLLFKAGDFAENITTDGINFDEIKIGTKLFLGDVVAEVTQKSKKCHTGCNIQKMTGVCAMQKMGIFAKILKSGEVFNESCCYYTV